jgi:hypothetical protein
MSSAFSRFPMRLQEAIVSRVGWSTLHPVQELASPESLEVMLLSAKVDSAAVFQDLRIIVIDEVHAIVRVV